jgi:hypothetical protein
MSHFFERSRDGLCPWLNFAVADQFSAQRLKECRVGRSGKIISLENLEWEDSTMKEK